MGKHGGSYYLYLLLPLSVTFLCLLLFGKQRTVAYMEQVSGEARVFILSVSVTICVCVCYYLCL
jgi:hypothetical protein